MGIDKRELRNATPADNVVAITPPALTLADELRAMADRIDAGQYGTIVVVAGVLVDHTGQTGPFTCGAPVSKAELVGMLNLATVRLALGE